MENKQIVDEFDFTGAATFGDLDSEGPLTDIGSTNIRTGSIDFPQSRLGDYKSEVRVRAAGTAAAVSLSGSREKGSVSKENFCFQAESRVMRKWAGEIWRAVEELSAQSQNEHVVYQLKLLAALIESYPEFIRGVTTETQTLI